jgi:DNA-binding Lrp family transcriptional regulator
MLADIDRALVAAVARGLPLVVRPYAALGAELGIEEGEVLERLRCLLSTGVIKRLGVVVRHHELGYRANAMVVWDVPDDRVAAAGARLGTQGCVTLCYRRPRRPPVWPYNLFCMIHGRDRSVVLTQVEEATAIAGLQGLPRAVLFSRRRFKQRGARYDAPSLPC